MPEAGLYRQSRGFDEPVGYDESPGRAGTPGPPPELPAAPGAGPGRRPAGNPIWFLIAVAAVIVVAAVVATVLLLGHHGPSHHVAASTPPASSPAHSPSASPTPSTTGKPPPLPPRTAANGHLGVPRKIGSLQLNPALTQRFVGPKAQRQFANSFFIPGHDVVSGFYTSDPSATTFTAKDPRLMFLAAYLRGSGDPTSALHSFMTNSTFYGQQQINAGPLGGKAACGQLAQQPAPVAHCMWADGNSYADFYAWNSSPSALAQTMMGIRPEVELAPR